MKYTREQIQAASEKLGHKYFTQGVLNVNIIGIRNSDTNGKVTNKFDDTMTISYMDNNMQWQYNEYNCTTDPGDDHVDNPMMEKGVAILKPGQYSGINIHRATALSGKTSTYIDRWSAGCQVIASNDDWHEFLNICQEARSEWSNSFTYTLIESKDIS